MLLLLAERARPIHLPALDLVLSGLATDGDGGLSLPATWPTGLPSDLTIYAQYWSRDNGFPPPNNVGLSGGIQFTVCP